ncbi:MAG TPA: redoxin domain-containing protein [Thermoanaerobaculia bacterium]|nr:redoxin domain-containing protein [Thermoanaerobaculia bacterium]
MRKITLTMLLLLALAAGPALALGAVGEAAPAFQLKDLNGKTHSLADYKGKVVVLEWVNPLCPFSDRHAREKTMSNLAKKHKNVVWLGINSTNASHANFLKPAEHQAWSQKNGVNYAVLYDETGKVGKAYDAKTTPHMYIIDEQGKIAYNGAIDDDPPGRTDAVKRVNYVDGGLMAELGGKNANPASTKPYGCSVKY